MVTTVIFCSWPRRPLATKQSRHPKTSFLSWTHPVQWPAPNCSRRKKRCGFAWKISTNDDRFEIVRFSTEAEPLFSRVGASRLRSSQTCERFHRRLQANRRNRHCRCAAKRSQGPTGQKRSPICCHFPNRWVCPRWEHAIPEEIVANIRKASGVRIFSFGIGSDVNTQLLDQIAEGTRAFSQYVLANEDLELKVSNFYTRIKEPALTNLKLDLGGAVHTTKMYPSDLPDLFKGDQLVVAGRYKRRRRCRRKAEWQRRRPRTDVYLQAAFR